MMDTFDEIRGGETAPRRESFLDYVDVLSKWKKFLIVNVLVLTIAMTGVTLVLPVYYKSTARLLPPREQGDMLSSISQLARDFLPMGSISKLAGSQGSYDYLAVLESRTAKKRVVEQFGLMEVYELASMERAIKALEGNVNFDIEQEGTIVVEVWDQNPERASQMANYFVNVLNEISIRLGTQEAKNNREFIEKRYLQVLEDLRASEDSLRVFQTKYGIYSIQEALSGKLLSSFVPYEEVPALTMQYIRLFRDYEIQHKLLEFVLPIYEQAKVSEQKETPVVLVLDEAVPAERKDRPKRAIIVVGTFLLTLTFFGLLAFLMESVMVRKKSVSGSEHRTGFVAWIARLYRIPHE